MKALNWYVEKIEELQNEVFVRPHQIVIDVFEDVLDNLKTDEFISFEAIIGRCIYRVETLLEVMNPDYITDVETLKKLLEILKTE